MKNVISFFREVKIEFSKIIWPSNKEFVISTFVVLVVVFLFTIYLGLMNFGLSSFIKKGFNLFIAN